MECGKFTAKPRNAVPVCFVVNGMEVKRLKNVEIPDEIKKLPFTVFKFDVPQNGVITFNIMFEAGVLPDEWPEPRQRKQRGSKVAGQPLGIAPETVAMLAASVRLGGYADAETVVAMETEAVEPEEMLSAPFITGDGRKAPLWRTTRGIRQSIRAHPHLRITSAPSP